MLEIWKPIPGYEGLYEASNLGRIRSIERTVEFIRHGKPIARRMKGQMLNPSSSSISRLSVMLSKNGKTKRFSVHSLICLTFHGPCPPHYDRVLHWDDNPLNNRADNLRWGDVRLNIEDERRNKAGRSGHYIHGKRRRREKEGATSQVDIARSHNRKLQPHQVRMIRKIPRFKKGMREKLARLWGVEPASITSARNKSHSDADRVLPIPSPVDLPQYA